MLEHLGKGGMGDVYKAIQAGLGSQCGAPRPVKAGTR
jgi:hypothetical protein